MNMNYVSVGCIAILMHVSLNAQATTMRDYIEQLYATRDGFSISQEENDQVTNQGGDPTYGEITFEGAEELLKYLKPKKRDVMYDLGSGVGKLVVQAHLTTPMRKVVGVELSPTRHRYAQEVKDQLKKEKKLKRRRALEFQEEDMAKTDLKDVTILYLPSTCFSSELMKTVMDNAAKARSKKLRIATLQEFPENNDFTLEKQLDLKMTWADRVAVFIYKRSGRQKPSPAV